MDAPVPLIAAAALAAGAMVLPGARGRAWAMVGALLLAPAILVSHIWDTEQLEPLRDSPALAAAAAIAGAVALAALALLFHRRASAFPLAVALAIPFRVPIASGGSTANLLVPLYLVVGAGALAYAIPRLRGAATQPEHPAGWLERALAASIVLYAAQATYADDDGKALESVVFFYVPFALLFVLLGRITWTRALVARCLAVLAGLAVVFAAIGFGEFATRHLLLNPKVIASNQFESYFRVNSLFFDPNIYGRFLAVVMLGLAAVLLWARRSRDVVIGSVALAVLWAGLLLTLSQSSFAALLVGLAVLAGARWNPRWAAAVTGAVALAAAVFVVAAPGAINLEIGDSGRVDDATSGRIELIEGGLDLFGEEPWTGYGSGSFAAEYRQAEKASSERATAASHTIPVTVAVEQGVAGLALYLLVLVLAFARLFAGVRASPPRAAVAAAFAALVLHTWVYAAFLEDPLTWALLGLGVALHRRDR